MGPLLTVEEVDLAMEKKAYKEALNNVVEQMHEKQVASLVKKLGNIPLSDSDVKREAHALKIPDFFIRIVFEQRPIIIRVDFFINYLINVRIKCLE